MKLHFILLIAFLGITLVACSKDDQPIPDVPDPCENVQCRNGGICIDGTCDCPDNTEGESCETKIPVALQIENIYCRFNSSNSCGFHFTTFETRLLYGANNSSPVLYNTERVSADGQQSGAAFNVSPSFELKNLDKPYGALVRAVCVRDPNSPWTLPSSRNILFNSFTPMEHYEKDNTSLAVIELGSSSLGIPITIEGTWIYE